MVNLEIVCPMGHINGEQDATVIDLEKKFIRHYCGRCGEWVEVKLCVEENCPIFPKEEKDGTAQNPT